MYVNVMVNEWSGEVDATVAEYTQPPREKPKKLRA